VSAAPQPTPDTVVMKFGGSSVADPDKVRHVARRLAEARERGLRVVATISAMGDTTDTLLELAERVSPHPQPRELDMLLATGERISCALVAMAVHDLGHEAVSFTGSQAGIITDRQRGQASMFDLLEDTTTAPAAITQPAPTRARPRITALIPIRQPAPISPGSPPPRCRRRWRSRWRAARAWCSWGGP